MKLRYIDYTKSDQETVTEIAAYMTTIGTKDNPGYRDELLSSRSTARELDAAYDLKHRKIDTSTHREAVHKLTTKWTLDEFKYALKCCRNNKGYFGDVHILFIKKVVR